MLRLNASLCSKIFFGQQKCSLIQINKTKTITKCYQRLQFSSQPESKTEEKLEKVYYGVLTPQIRAVKVFSLSSSMGGLIAQPFLYSKAAEIGGTPMIVAVCGFIGFFTFITPLLLHLITKKYVTEMEYNSATNTYSATTISFFLIRQKIYFTPEDVVVPDMLGMFTTFNIKGKPVFVDLKQFSDPFHYAKIMGYDKPIDFKFSEVTPVRDDNDTKK